MAAREAPAPRPLPIARRTIDLTQPFFHACGFNPDLPQPTLRVVRQVASHGARLEQLELCTHVGTHMDAPTHVFETGTSIDEIEPDRLHGRAAVADLRGMAPGSRIGVAELEALDLPLDDSEILLLATGWGNRREHSNRYVNESPWLDGPGAELIVSKGIHGVVIDHFSIASRGDPEKFMPAHLALLGAGSWIVEDAYFPEEVFDGGRWYVVALPLRIREGSGAPTRVIAFDA